MKEHSLFLLAGFPAKETEYIRCADQFREVFEEGLRKTVKLADSIVSRLSTADRSYFTGSETVPSDDFET